MKKPGASRVRKRKNLQINYGQYRAAHPLGQGRSPCPRRSRTRSRPGYRQPGRPGEGGVRRSARTTGRRSGGELLRPRGSLPAGPEVGRQVEQGVSGSAHRGAGLRPASTSRGCCLESRQTSCSIFISEARTPLARVALAARAGIAPTSTHRAALCMHRRSRTHRCPS